MKKTGQDGIHLRENIYSNGTGNPPEETYYFAPLQGYLYEGAKVYSYEASTAAVSEAVLEEAALAMGNEYMKELCSQEYEGGPEERNKIWAYKDFRATITNRMTNCYMGYQVVEISAPEYADWDWMGWKWNGYGVRGLAKSDQIWIVEYDIAAMKVEGGGYGAIYPISRYEWFKPAKSIFEGKSGVMVKEGNTYYLIFQEDVVPRKFKVGE